MMRDDEYYRKWITLKEYLDNTIIKGQIWEPENKINDAKIHTLKKVKEFMDELEKSKCDFIIKAFSGE